MDPQRNSQQYVELAGFRNPNIPVNLCPSLYLAHEQLEQSDLQPRQRFMAQPF